MSWFWWLVVIVGIVLLVWFLRKVLIKGLASAVDDMCIPFSCGIDAIGDIASDAVDAISDIGIDL